MIDLGKKSEVPVVLQSELRELSTTNKKLNDDLELARYKIKGELDALTYKVEKIAYETEEIRREIRDINRTVDKLRYDLLDAIRNSKKSDMHDWLMSLFPIVAVAAPALVAVAVVAYKFLTR